MIENSGFSYEIGRDGKNLSFTDKNRGDDYLFKDTVSYCASVIKDGKTHNVSNVDLKGDTLFLDFNTSDFKAKLLLTRNQENINIKITDINGQAESLNFINIPLTLEGMTSEPFAACALSMNLFTHVHQLPALQTHLWSSCYERFGMKGAELTIVGVPQEEILPAIRNVMENASGV
ncbi:MAG: hypothetical protein PHH93_14155, partial [Prolixibacteraceae bacterium]|nr:hypothetical protein [Prolixibacteraceae bacterium]